MDAIKRRRQELGMSQADLARKLGITQIAVSKWENGDNYPKSTRLRDVADALGCTVDDLLRKEVDAHADEANEV